jgi:hypothetical protein
MESLGDGSARGFGLAGGEARPYRFGAVEFRARGQAIGHPHASRIADLPVLIRMRRDLVAEGKAEPHHPLPQSTPAATTPADRSTRPCSWSCYA